jgi:hypothetical protein
MFRVYPCAAWCRVTDVLQMNICNSADVYYVSFIQSDVTLFIDRTNVLRYLWITYVIMLALEFYIRMLSLEVHTYRLQILLL